MEQKLNVLSQDDNKVIVIEEKKYTMDRNTLQNQLYNIQHQKEILIEQSKRIKQDFDNLTEQEDQYKEILAKWQEDELTEVIELGV